MPYRWCTVCLIERDGTRHSLDLRADSSYDAAHLYVTAALSPDSKLPKPTLDSRFEVVFGGAIYQVRGRDLQKWIEKKRLFLRGPVGDLFCKRPKLPG